jgi:hypothetical protein
MKALLKALDKFQAECPAVGKSASNPFFKSKYATLDAIQHHIKPYLHKNGLVVTQVNIVAGEQGFVQTNVWHTESGETMLSTFPIIVQKHSAQDYGSAVSYAKRYSLSGLLNIIIEDEDDDGNRASNPTPTIVLNQTAVPTDTDKPWLNKQNPNWDVIVQALKDAKTDIKRLRTKYKISKAVEAELSSL